MHATPRTLALILALPLTLTLGTACDKGKSDEDKKAETEEPKIEQKDPTTLFTGDKVTMPEVYGGLKIGMTKDEAKAAFPGLPDDDPIKPPEYEGMWFTTDFDDDTGELTRVYFSMKKEGALEAAKAKWGEPKEGTDLDRKVQWWFNPEANLRASIMDSFSEGEVTVEFTEYWPVTQLLGEGPEIAFEKDAPLLGLTVADLDAKYPKWVKKESEEEAAKTQEQIAAMAGEEAKALMGKPTASVDLEYPPTEWGKYWTPVHLSWSDEGKIERFWFGIDFEPHPPAKDEIMALLKKKWGEPKEEEKYGDKLYVFGEDPRIEVKEDTISNKWDISVEPKE